MEYGIPLINHKNKLLPCLSENLLQYIPYGYPLIRNDLRKRFRQILFQALQYPADILTIRNTVLRNFAKININNRILIQMPMAAFRLPNLQPAKKISCFLCPP